MKFTIKRDIFLPAVQSVIGAIERRQTLPILNNLLIQVFNNQIIITATDLEIELKNTINLDGEFDNFEFTLPARKIADICKNIEEGSFINFRVTEENTIITTNKSKFTLSNLPSADYPKIENLNFGNKLTIEENKLKTIIHNVSFAMAQQDVRYYLNGVLFELTNEKITAVTTDGHRLALSETNTSSAISEVKQIILPRKSVIELQRILNDTSNIININIDNNHIQFKIGDIVLTSKLIDGKFPDYKRVIPLNNDKLVKISKGDLKQALIRSAIISNEKFKGAKFNFTKNLLTIETQNSERENSKEELIVDYTSDDLSIGFNISYILDVVNLTNNEYINLELKSPDTSCVIRLVDDENIESIYVVMPMRI